MYKYIIFLTILAMFSCSREDFTGEPTEVIDIPPSEQVDVYPVFGSIHDTDDNPVADADITLYNEEDVFIETTQTNALGEFTFFDLIEDQIYYVHIAHDAYIARYDLIHETSAMELDFEVELLSIFEFPGLNPINPADSGYVTISGLIDTEGPVLIKAIQSDVFMTCLNVTFSENGSFSMLVPRNVDFDLWILGFECPNSEPEVLDNLRFDEDTILSDIGIVVISETNTLEGIAVDCDRELITEGTLYFYSDSPFGLELVAEYELTDGTFSISYNTCDSGKLFVEYEDDSGEFFEPIPVFDDENLELQFCGDFELEGILTGTIGQDSIELMIYTEWENGNATVYGFDLNNGSFTNLLINIEQVDSVMPVVNFFVLSYEDNSYEVLTMQNIIIEEFEPPIGFEDGALLMEISGTVQSLSGAQLDFNFYIDSPVY